MFLNVFLIFSLNTLLEALKIPMYASMEKKGREIYMYLSMYALRHNFA